MKIYLATWLFEKSQGEALTKKGYAHRLLSFFHTREKIPEFTNYVRIGLNEDLPCGTSRKRTRAS